MSEAAYVELPVLAWMCGEPTTPYRAGGLGWTYRDEEAMAAFDRPLEDALVEKILIERLKRFARTIDPQNISGQFIERFKRANQT